TLLIIEELKHDARARAGTGSHCLKIIVSEARDAVMLLKVARVALAGTDGIAVNPMPCRVNAHVSVLLVSAVVHFIVEKFADK
ncbi:hypothetical protein PV325_008120, partial [Microctonus aethiopoides]